MEILGRNSFIPTCCHSECLSFSQCFVFFYLLAFCFDMPFLSMRLQCCTVALCLARYVLRCFSFAQRSMFYRNRYRLVGCYALAFEWMVHVDVLVEIVLKHGGKLGPGLHTRQKNIPFHLSWSKSNIMLIFQLWYSNWHGIHQLITHWHTLHWCSFFFTIAHKKSDRMFTCKCLDLLLLE